MNSKNSIFRHLEIILSVIVLAGSPSLLHAQSLGVTLQPTNDLITTTAGSTVTLTALPTGTGPFTYQWRLNGTNLPDGLITTVAGAGVGDGVPAANARLSAPEGAAVDADGNLFIADYFNNLIRKIGTNGIITTVAGNGMAGYSGDGGAATNAELANPAGVAVDTSGNLLFADSYNNVIRKVDTNGIITTVAGNIDGGGYSGDGGAATNAELANPLGVAVDAGGNLFIADEVNSVVRQVDINGIITTVAGNGTVGYSGDGGIATNAELNGLTSVAVDAKGDLFIAESQGNRIRKVGINGIITTVAGNGTAGYSGNSGMATNAALNFPEGVVVDSGGNLFIADSYNNVIRQVGTNGIITTVAGNGYDAGLGFGAYSGDGGAATNAELSLFYVNFAADGIAVDACGNLFIADSGNNVIRKVDTNGIITTVAGNEGYSGYSENGGSAANAVLFNPEGVALDVGGNLFIADTLDNVIREMATNGIITTVAGNGYGAGGSGLHGGYSGDGGAATNAEFWYPTGLAVDAIGNLFIGDLYNRVLRKVDTNGIITTLIGWPSFSGDGVVVDQSDNLFIADSFDNAIIQADTNGNFTVVAGDRTRGYSGDGGAATDAELSGPSGVAMDAGGNLFIADNENNVIRKMDTNGIITTVAGDGTGGYFGDGGEATNAQLNLPNSVAVDTGGNLFIADSYNNVIRKVGTDGIITTVAGNGYGAGLGFGGYSGDNEAATNAELNNPASVAVDGGGNLLIADMFNSRIRKVTFNSSVISPTLLLSNVGVGNAGAYDVVVSNPNGSVTSTVVNVTIMLSAVTLSKPQITVGNRDFQFQVSGPAGSNVVVQVSSDLLNWSSVSTSTIPINGFITLSNAMTGHNRQFYRAHSQ